MKGILFSIQVKNIEMLWCSLSRNTLKLEVGEWSLGRAGFPPVMQFVGVDGVLICDSRCYRPFVSRS